MYYHDSMWPNCQLTQAYLFSSRSHWLSIFQPAGEKFLFYEIRIYLSFPCGSAGFDPWIGKIPWRRERLPTPIFWPGEFLIGFFVLMWLSIMSCLQILETNPLLITTSANIFSQSLGCLFILFIASFDTWKLFSFVVQSLSHVRLFATPWSIAHQAPLSMGFSRQEYWSGLPFPSPGDLSNPGIEPSSPSLQIDALTSELPGKP